MPVQTLQARALMSAHQSQPALGASPLLHRMPLFTALCLLAALVTLAGCAPLHPTRLPEATREPDASTQPKSAAVPAKEVQDAEEPPSSIAVPTPDLTVTRVLVVRASAYNSRSGQTDSTPNVAAWGDRLEPGMKVVAVSKDLVELELSRGQRIRIDGLDGEYVVMDRMPSRWRQKIDIYMGEDVRAALNWGVREVEISWHPDVHDVERDDLLDSTGAAEAQ